MKRILHTEASLGWGGQEMRILKESIAMRELGHEIFILVNQGGQLAEKAREAGFPVYTMRMSKKRAPFVIFQMCRLLKELKIDIINTHSSIDAWLGGIAGRLYGCKVMRTRHISAPIKPGLNSKLLYDTLADFTITTCEEVAEIIRKQAKLTEERCQSIPTGINPSQIITTPEAVVDFKNQYDIQPHHIVVGTTCVLRSWKGIEDFLKAAQLLKDKEELRWFIIGSGPGDQLYRKMCQEMGLEKQVIFTGFLDNPFAAIGSLDIFLLLSTANEGVSQASLQAAYLKKPLITTPTGGLKEVCLHGKNGYTVPIHSPKDVAHAVSRLAANPVKREEMGESAYQHIVNNYLISATSNRISEIYNKI